MLHFNTLVILQIITESFPISSSGHLLLVQCIGNFFSLLQNASYLHLLSNDMVTSFINMPMVIVLALFFYQQWVWFLIHWRRTWRMILKLIGYAFVADVITAAIFLLARISFFSLPLYIGFAITGVLLFSLHFCAPPIRSRSSTFFVACILGFVQGIACLPGISRFAIVYTAARWLRFDARKAFALTWMIHWPLIFAASSLSVGLMLKNPAWGDFITSDLLIHMIGASIFSFFGLLIMYFLARTYRLWWVSIYMIVPTLLAYFIC